MSPRPNGESEDLPLRPRSSSLVENDESTSSSLATLDIGHTSGPRSRLSVPMPTESEGRFSSYTITRGRAVSPVVSNYFGLPTDRETEKSSSMPFFGGPSRGENEEYGALNFLSRKLAYRYGLFGSETKSNENPSDSGNEDDDVESSDLSESDSSHGTEQEDENDDEGEDQNQNHIEIFGHQ